MGIGKRVRPEGPVPSRFMAIGEWPGKDDAISGRVFSARGRRENEIDRFFDGVRLPERGDWFLTYAIKEWCGEDGEYTAEDFERDLPDLLKEIEKVQPEFIVALGRNITRFLMGDVDMEEVHGIPWRVPADAPVLKQIGSSICFNPVIFPIVNPAAGFRAPELSAQITYDFSTLESVLSGELQPRVLYDDPIPHPVYEEVQTEAQLDAIMVDATTISTDSEGYPWNPWSVQITTRDGESYILRYKIGGQRNPLLERFVFWVNTCREIYRFVFHNSLHDLSVFRAIGIDTTELVFDDTMLMSYALQLEPQGLKPLCLRWCGMKMEHYEDVMGDATTRLARDWLTCVLENEETAYTERCHEEFIRLTTTPYTDKRGRLIQGRKLRVPPKLPRTALHKAAERCLRSARSRGLWDDQVIDLHVEADEKYGPIWEATLDHVPLRRALDYAGRDSDGTHRLEPALRARLRAHDLDGVYSADLATVPLIDRMQQVGIRPDLGHFAALSHDLGVEIVEIRARLAGRLVGLSAVPDLDAGQEFNPNSGPQTAELLHERLGLDVLKKTREGDPSTNDKVLEALEKNPRLDVAIRDLIGDIRYYRETYKLKSTFVDQIPDFVNRWPWDGRIHPTFRITRVVTGRLAASNPNILAMPKHGKFAKRFRAGFVAGEGQYICSWDLSQIELRVLAHLSQDPVLLDAFRTGKDLHARLAQRIFGVDPKNQDDSKHRLPAKAINFGIPMGMTAIGLCLELRKNGVDVTEDDAQRWLTETMALYARVPEYQQGKVAEAKRFGFVTDIRGRRRYIGGIRSFDNAVRSEAERFAFSTPIQAGAQEVMKEAEAYVYRDILLPHWKARRQVEPLIQIHDDLVLESGLLRDGRVVPHPSKPGKKVIEFKNTELHDQMVYAMTKVPAHWLSVPIETDGTAGPNWGELYGIRKAA